MSAVSHLDLTVYVGLMHEDSGLFCFGPSGSLCIRLAFLPAPTHLDSSAQGV